MPLVPFTRMMKAAVDGGYAVGYFESWNLESLLAVADAAEAGASGVVSDGAGSLAHLDRHAAAYDLHVRGLYELLADHLAA